jgi:hypothetical protein
MIRDAQDGGELGSQLLKQLDCEVEASVDVVNLFLTMTEVRNAVKRKPGARATHYCGVRRMRAGRFSFGLDSMLLVHSIFA